MRQLLYLVLACTIQCLFIPSSQAQLLKKMKEKVNQAVDKTLEKKVGDATGTETQNQPTTNSGSPSNSKGGGLKNTTPPDVKEEMTIAEKSFAEAKYSDARYSIQQALTGIEIQLGKLILKSLPDKVTDMTKDTTKNIVSSSQWGWNNLTIQSVYKKDPDKQMTISIGNNTYYSGIVNMYYMGTSYQQGANSEQNMKQIRVKGNKALITYDDNKGYTVMVQLGQSSLIVWECVNFATEDEVMSAVNTFDIDGIKKMMGEK